MNCNPCLVCLGLRLPDNKGATPDGNVSEQPDTDYIVHVYSTDFAISTAAYHRNTPMCCSAVCTAAHCRLLNKGSVSVSQSKQRPAKVPDSRLGRAATLNLPKTTF